MGRIRNPEGNHGRWAHGFAFNVYSDFENYAGGIYHHVSGGLAGGHAVKVVGWGVENGVKYWKIANSWNPYWGEKGYFRIKFGEGGIDDQAIASSPDAKWSWAGSAEPVPDGLECDVCLKAVGAGVEKGTQECEAA